MTFTLAEPNAVTENNNIEFPQTPDQLRFGVFFNFGWVNFFFSATKKYKAKKYMGISDESETKW